MQPVAVCEVAYEKNDPAALLSRPPFVGRAAQIERLNGKLDIASSGHGTVVTVEVTPDPGAPKMSDEKLAELVVSATPTEDEIQR